MNQPQPQLTPFDLGYQPSDQQAAAMSQQNQPLPSQSNNLPNVIPVSQAHLLLPQLAPQPSTAPVATPVGSLRTMVAPPQQNTSAATPTLDPSNLPDTIPLNLAGFLLPQMQQLGGNSGKMAPPDPMHSPADHFTSSQWGTARNPTDIPIKGPITQEFGTTAFAQANPGIYHGSGHNGVDIGVPTGTELPTNIDGTILQVGDMGKSAYGKYIVLQGSDGVTRLFGHLSKQLVQPGQKVAVGTLLGLTGSTGDATGPHLHYSEFTPTKK